jgi:hypothetical protein
LGSGTAGESEARFTAPDPVNDWYRRAVGLLLAVLHGVEATIWAAVYVWLGVLYSLKDAILYSIDWMTTRGASGLTLERQWLDA